jgi:hypothetical protein
LPQAALKKAAFLFVVGGLAGYDGTRHISDWVEVQQWEAEK